MNTRDIFKFKRNKEGYRLDVFVCLYNILALEFHLPNDERDYIDLQREAWQKPGRCHILV